jgi:hypothetical protein
VTEHEDDLLFQAEVGEPLPSEHALGADDQVLTEALDGSQEVARLSPHVPMQKLSAFMVEDAKVHPLRVQIDAAIISVLAVVESHHDPPC